MFLSRWGTLPEVLRRLAAAPHRGLFSRFPARASARPSLFRTPPWLISRQWPSRPRPSPPPTNRARGGVRARTVRAARGGRRGGPHSGSHRRRALDAALRELDDGLDALHVALVAPARARTAPVEEEPRARRRDELTRTRSTRCRHAGRAARRALVNGQAPTKAARPDRCWPSTTTGGRRSTRPTRQAELDLDSTRSDEEDEPTRRRAGRGAVRRGAAEADDVDEDVAEDAPETPTRPSASGSSTPPAPARPSPPSSSTPPAPVAS